VKTASRGLRLELLPTPEPDKVVIMLLQKLKISVEVYDFRNLGALRPRPHAIVEIVPDMGAGQIDGFLFRGGCDREVTGVRAGNPEWSRGRIRYRHDYFSSFK